MKKLMLLGLLTLFGISVGAQSPAPGDSPRIAAMMKEVQAQQAQIADNQAKIDAKLVALVEAIRVAKIYASRGGR